MYSCGMYGGCLLCWAVIGNVYVVFCLCVYIIVLLFGRHSQDPHRTNYSFGGKKYLLFSFLIRKG